MDDSMAERLTWFGIDGTSQEALQAAAVIILPRIEAILDGFYTYLAATPTMAARFSSEAQIADARSAQAEHWKRLFSGRFDAEYFESAERIGRTHFRIGLPLREYMAGYATVGARILALIVQRSRGRLGRAELGRGAAMVDAVQRTLMLDVDITIAFFQNAQTALFQVRMQQIAERFDTQVGQIIGSVTSASVQLASVAKGMSSRAAGTARQAQSAAAAAEEAAANVESVSGATGQLSASIGEIASQIRIAAEVTDRATDQARRTDDLVSSLKAAGDRIGTVVDLISDIASQTNLLALNATVEAARAGDAGKGFAVVAHEVKQLSTNTAEATEEIRTQIEHMQAETAAAVEAIRAIAATIGRHGEISQALGTAIDQQRVATGDIAGNAEATAAGTGQMARSIEAMSNTLTDAEVTSAQVLEAASELSESSIRLRSQVDGFLAEVRAA